MQCAQWACRFKTSSDEQSLAIAGYSIELAEVEQPPIERCSDAQSLAIAGYSIDMRVHDMRQRKQQHRGLGRVGSGVRWAFAFFGMQVATGTLMKRRHLELLGHTACCVLLIIPPQVTSLRDLGINSSSSAALTSTILRHFSSMPRPRESTTAAVDDHDTLSACPSGNGIG